MAIKDLCPRCNRLHVPNCGKSGYEVQLEDMRDAALAAGVPAEDFVDMARAAAGMPALSKSAPHVPPAAEQGGPYRARGDMMRVDAGEQDPGDVFPALADAFSNLASEEQTNAINKVTKAMHKALQKALDKSDGKKQDALMIAINMVRTMFASKGRVVVLRVAQAAVLISQVAPEAPLEVVVRKSGTSSAADAAAVGVAKTVLQPAEPL